MTFTIYPVGQSTGGVNLVPYIAYGGISWQRADVDGEDAGRTMDGEMHRDRVAIKYRIDVRCRPLTSAELAIVLTAIEPEFIDVVCDDPRYGTIKRRTVYSNNIPATLLFEKDGVDYWSGISFPLIEK